MMNRLALALLPLASACWISCSGPQHGARSGEVVLFNGQNLAGWRAVLAKPELKIDDVWSVRDGTIVCKGEPLGFMETEQSFTDFRLQVEWRWAPGKTPGNSGVFLRINGARTPLPRCLECQLKSGDAGDLYGFHGMRIDGEPARRTEVKNHELGGDFVGVKKRGAPETTPGEWNHLEVLAEGPKITVWVNGQKVNEAFGCEVVAGPIGLQSEGGEVHFRNVRVTPLGK